MTLETFAIKPRSPPTVSKPETLPVAWLEATCAALSTTPTNPPTYVPVPVTVPVAKLFWIDEPAPER